MGFWLILDSARFTRYGNLTLSGLLALGVVSLHLKFHLDPLRLVNDQFDPSFAWAAPTDFRATDSFGNLVGHNKVQRTSQYPTSCRLLDGFDEGSGSHRISQCSTLLVEFSVLETPIDYVLHWSLNQIGRYIALVLCSPAELSMLPTPIDSDRGLLCTTNQLMVLFNAQSHV